MSLEGLCDSCRLLAFDLARLNNPTSWSEWKYYPSECIKTWDLAWNFQDTYPSLPKLTASANQGCSFCALLLSETEKRVIEAEIDWMDGEDCGHVGIRFHRARYTASEINSFTITRGALWWRLQIDVRFFKSNKPSYGTRDRKFCTIWFDLCTAEGMVRFARTFRRLRPSLNALHCRWLCEAAHGDASEKAIGRPTFGAKQSDCQWMAQQLQHGPQLRFRLAGVSSPSEALGADP